MGISLATSTLSGDAAPRTFLKTILQWDPDSIVACPLTPRSREEFSMPRNRSRKGGDGTMGQRMDHYLEHRFLSVGRSHAQFHFLFIFHIITSSPVVPEESKFSEQALPATTGCRSQSCPSKRFWPSDSLHTWKSPEDTAAQQTSGQRSNCPKGCPSLMAGYNLLRTFTSFIQSSQHLYEVGEQRLQSLKDYNP